MSDKKTDKSDPKAELPATAVRVDPRVKLEFHLKWKSLANTRTARYKGEPPLQETTTAALWLWFARKSKEDAEAFLEEMFREMELFLAEDAPGPGEDIHSVKKRPDPAKTQKEKRGG